MLRPTFWLILPIVAGIIILVTACDTVDHHSPPQTVAHVDLNRYTGTWYQIALIPNRFQRRCAADTTATYELGADGHIDITNRCRTADGTYDEVHGLARVIDPRTNAKLEVSFVKLFGWHLFWGDYWILDLGPRYRYAIVGTPDRRFGWVLSRTPSLPARTRAAIDRKLIELGYKPSEFLHTPYRPAS
ncbi:MAG: lipocalin family protein [Gammaproteobacteria bacterium]